MIAVADTSPLCYLILIDEIDLLPRLFSQVVAPAAVISELLHEDAPKVVRVWAANLPRWISAQENPVRDTSGLEKLQAGERSAILIAESIRSRHDPARRKGGPPYCGRTRPADCGHTSRLI